MILSKLMFVLILFNNFQAVDDGQSSRKAKDQIINKAKVWSVQENKGAIKFKLKLILNGNLKGEIGYLRGTATIKYKQKEIVVKMSAKLKSGKYLFLTRYPALKGVFLLENKSKTGSFPLKKRMRYKETLVLKKDKLCPISTKFPVKCMKPVK